MNEEKIKNLVTDYKQSKSNYDELSKKLSTLIEELLKEKGIQCHSITNRSKEVESFKKKISNPEKNYVDLKDITDLCGIRIITYFSDDVDNVASIIEKEFSIDKINSIDKRHGNDPDRFGYLSLHYVAKLNNKRETLTEYKKYKDLKFEIQIRSILQHAWAEIEHDIGYKSELSLPSEFRRRFARVSGLLEIADNEFNELRSNLTKYKKAIDKNLPLKSKTIEVNSITIKSFIKNNGVIEDLQLKISTTLNLEVKDFTNQIIEDHVKRLNYLNIKNINDVERLVKKHADIIPTLFSKFREKHDFAYTKTITNGMPLLYSTYIEAIQNTDQKFLFNLIRSFTKISDEEIIKFIDNFKSSYEEIIIKK